MVRAAFKRLTRPAKGSIYTPAELVVLLNQFDYTAAGLPTKRLTRALSLCLDNKVIDTHLFGPFVCRVCRDSMCPLFDHLRPINRVKHLMFSQGVCCCVCAVCLNFAMVSLCAVHVTNHQSTILFANPTSLSTALLGVPAHC